jgi:hypothetical protein
MTSRQILQKIFQLAFNILKNKEHLKKEGFNKLLSIKSSMNQGLSLELNSLSKY